MEIGKSIGMKSKGNTRRNIRKQRNDSDEEASDNASNVNVHKAPDASRSCLSFADEIDTNDWKIKQNQKSKTKVNVPPDFTISKDVQITKENPPNHEFQISVKPLKLPAKRKPSKSAYVQPTSNQNQDDKNAELISIPDAHAIHEARLRRQRMREAFDRGEILLPQEEIKVDSKS
ncbi:hypothetical protein GJ496_006574 [Pomphorhynchus laevis]|nr:hypothetical protein GJ496_006574 [Pomphorhynchus laevis]